MTKRVVVYADESGNSGPEYLDQQAFYVLAAWVVPVEYSVEVAMAVEDFRRQFTTATSPTIIELPKMKMNKARNQRKMITFLKRLGDLHCVPIYVVAEKRYCLGAHVVEALLDPESNDRVKLGFLQDFQTKQELADTFSRNLPDQVLRRLTDCYKQPDEEEFKKIQAEIIGETKKINFELAEVMAGSLAHRDEIAQLEMDFSLLGKGKHTPNLPMLVSLLMLIEGLGRLGTIEPDKLVHDTQTVYEVDYRRVFEMHKKSADYAIVYPDDPVQYTYLRHIPEFEIQDSASSPFIQAADWLARSISYICGCIGAGKKLTSLELELADLVLPPLIMKEPPKLAWQVVSEQFIRNLGQCWIGAKKPCPPAAPDYVTPDRVFPIAGDDLPLPSVANIMSFDLPRHVILRRGDHAPLILDLQQPGDTLDGKSALPVFSSMDLAHRHIEAELGDRDEWEVFTFENSGQGFIHFIVLLESLVEKEDLITFDPSDQPLKVSPLRVFHASLMNMMSRVIRMIGDGFSSTFMKKQRFDGREVITFQSYTGEYIATVDPREKIYKGRTREEALEECRKGEGL